MATILNYFKLTLNYNIDNKHTELWFLPDKHLYGTDTECRDICKLVKIDSQYFRPNEVDLLLGDATKANNELGWKPKHTVEELIVDMVKSDIELFEKDKYLKNGGFEIYNNYE